MDLKKHDHYFINFDTVSQHGVKFLNLLPEEEDEAGVSMTEDVAPGPQLVATAAAGGVGPRLAAPPSPA